MNLWVILPERSWTGMPELSSSLVSHSDEMIGEGHDCVCMRICVRISHCLGVRTDSVRVIMCWVYVLLSLVFCLRTMKDVAEHPWFTLTLKGIWQTVSAARPPPENCEPIENFTSKQSGSWETNFDWFLNRKLFGRKSNGREIHPHKCKAPWF